MMTASEFERLIKERFVAAGLDTYIDRQQEQYLELESELFAEIVVTDASKLEDARALWRAIRDELKGKGVAADAVVRAMWRIAGEPEYRGPARSLSGAIAAALDYEVPLVSGPRKHTVRVQLTNAALDRMRERLRSTSRPLSTEDEVDRDLMVRAVKEFVALELGLGGESYWDPERAPVLSLDAPAMSYVLSHPVAI